MSEDLGEHLKIVPDENLVCRALDGGFAPEIYRIIERSYPHKPLYNKEYAMNGNTILAKVDDELYNIIKDVIDTVKKISPYNWVKTYVSIYSNLGLIYLIVLLDDWVDFISYHEEALKKAVEETNLRLRAAEVDPSDFSEVKFFLKKGDDISITNPEEVELLAAFLQQMKSKKRVDQAKFDRAKAAVNSLSKPNRETPKRRIEKLFMRAAFELISFSAKDSRLNSRYIAVNKFLRLLGFPIANDDTDYGATEKAISRMKKEDKFKII